MVSLESSLTSSLPLWTPSTLLAGSPVNTAVTSPKLVTEVFQSPTFSKSSTDTRLSKVSRAISSPKMTASESAASENSSSLQLFVWVTVESAGEPVMVCVPPSPDVRKSTSAVVWSMSAISSGLMPGMNATSLTRNSSIVG